MNTLFDKIWDKHVVQIVEDGPTQLYIDRLYCHEVTSPQAFAGMRARGLKMFRPDQIFCMPDHNTPTHDQDKPIEDPVSKKQVDTLAKNTADFGVTHFAMNTKDNGIIHVFSVFNYIVCHKRGCIFIVLNHKERGFAYSIGRRAIEAEICVEFAWRELLFHISSII